MPNDREDSVGGNERAGYPELIEWMKRVESECGPQDPGLEEAVNMRMNGKAKWYQVCIELKEK